MSSTVSSKLFQPVQIGKLTLSHRIVLAPLTRMRANADHVHGDLAVEYYSQRASTPGTLLITEGTLIHPKAGGYNHVPQIFSDTQIQAWKKIVDAVHAKGSFIYMQLWALGRADRVDPFGPSAIPTKGRESQIPRALTTQEIEEFVELYRIAAENAVHKAGFDGVELHNANGYLLDQFLQDNSNARTDEYGGSIENKCRFPLQVLDAVVKAVGQERTAVRLSPWSTLNDAGMEDPKPTFCHFVSRIRDLYPNLSFLHIVEPHISGDSTTEALETSVPPSNDFLREIWQPRPYISAGNFTRESALKASDKTGELIAFGRWFISNPDLPLRLKRDIALTKYDRSDFYIAESPKGYIDYPFAKF